MSKKKNVPKSVKNVLNWVIGPVEFRKTGYFATWWRLVAREHDLKPKMKVFLLLVNFKKLKNTLIYMKMTLISNLGGFCVKFGGKNLSGLKSKMTLY